MPDKVYDNFIKLHSAYENKALRILLKEFNDLFSSINFGNLSFDERISESVIALNINEDAIEKALFKVHYTIGLQYGRMIARQIRKQNPINQKAFNPLPFFDTEFRDYILDYFHVYGGRQIKTLSKTAVRSVIAELRKSTRENESLEQMRDRIMKKVKKKDFYAWQAMRIARTETTIAMNSAKEIAGITSGVEMDKIWLTRLDGRERHTHEVANQQKTTQKGLFTVGGYKMKFPGDRTNGAPADEIINCRCTYSYQAKRNESGSLIFNDEEEIQAMLREMRG